MITRTRNGQFEINWNYNDALPPPTSSASSSSWSSRSPRRHGLRATFMPKPFINLTGNGCHVHLSVWDAKRRSTTCSTIPRATGSFGARLPLPGRAHPSCPVTGGDHQSDGQLLQAHQRAGHPLRRHLVAEHGHLRRQQPHPHGAHSRRGTHRVPPARRCGQPLPDDGRHPGRRRPRHGEARMDPGKRLDIDMYAEGHTVKDAKKLPLNLLDACAISRTTRIFARPWVQEVSAAYLKLRHNEWNHYCRHLTSGNARPRSIADDRISLPLVGRGRGGGRYGADPRPKPAPQGKGQEGMKPQWPTRSQEGCARSDSSRASAVAPPSRTQARWLPFPAASPAQGLHRRLRLLRAPGCSRGRWRPSRRRADEVRGSHASRCGGSRQDGYQVLQFLEPRRAQERRGCSPPPFEGCARSRSSDPPPVPPHKGEGRICAPPPCGEGRGGGHSEGAIRPPPRTPRRKGDRT